MATVSEIDDAVTTARSAGCRELILLKCTSNYPASPSASNLRAIPHLREVFGCEVGLSDHTLGIGVGVASVAFGAVVIEKHVTLKREDGGVDSAFSLEPHELAQLVSDTRVAWEALGTTVIGPSDAERSSLVFRRSLYIVEDIPAGGVINENNMRAIRPGYGLPPKHYDDLIGKRVAHAVRRGTPVTWDLIG